MRSGAEIHIEILLSFDYLRDDAMLCAEFSWRDTTGVAVLSKTILENDGGPGFMKL